MKKLYLMALVALLTCATATVNAQFFTTPPTIDGNVDAGYVTGVNGWSIGWDDTYLYLRKSTTDNQPVIAYFDIDPVVPVSGGTNTNGSLTGFTHWGITPGLPFRADFKIYWEESLLEYQTDNGTGDWNSINTIGISERTNGNANKECRIPWSLITGAGRPASFNWFGYCNSRVDPGFIFDVIPGNFLNPGGANLPAPKFNGYHTVTNTNSEGTVSPVDLNFRSLEIRSDFGYTGDMPAALYDVTVNSTGNNLRLLRNLDIANNLFITTGGLRADGGNRTLTFTSGSGTLTNNGTMFGEFGGNLLTLTFAGSTTLAGSSIVDARIFNINEGATLDCNTRTLNSNSSGGVVNINGTIITSSEFGLYDNSNSAINSNGITRANINLGSNSTVIFDNSNDVFVDGDFNYQNLTLIGNSGNQFSIKERLFTVNKAFIFNDCILAANTDYIVVTLNGTVSGNGVFSSFSLGNSASNLDRKMRMTINGTGPFGPLNFDTDNQFKNQLDSLVINRTGTVTLGTDVNVTDLRLNNGILDANGNLITLPNNGLYNETSTSYVLGEVQKTMDIGTGANVNTQVAGIQINNTAGASLGSTLIRMISGTPVVGPNDVESIARNFIIVPSVQPLQNSPVLLTYRWPDALNNNITFSNEAAVWKRTPPATQWSLLGDDFNISANNGINSITFPTPSFSEFAIIDPATPLNISLSNFTAQAIKNTAELTWETASETDSRYFSIERSANGTIFETIAEVIAAGNSSTNQFYNYTDQNPLQGTNYYRLGLHSQEKVEYSAIRMLNFSKNQVINVFPNPAKNNLFVDLSTLENSNRAVLIQIMDLNGKVLLSRELQNSSPVDLINLAKGLYFLNITIDGKQSTQKLVID